MSTQANANQPSQPQANESKIEVNLAPVIPAPKPTVSPEIMALYVRQVSKGLPTKVKGVPILPARLSQLALTDEQREMIRASRETFRRACMADKKNIIGILRKKSVHTVAHKTTGKGGSIRYADQKAYKTPAHFEAYVSGKRLAPVA